MKKNSKIIISSILLGSVLSLVSCNSESKKIDANKYNLTIAAQAEDGEQEILSALKKAYEEEHPDVNIIIRDFAGKTFVNLMEDYANDHSLIPNMLWMDDRDFAGYAKGGFFKDLRPYYEKSSDTDYSLYYETMLDSAAYNGTFCPTTNYQGTFAREKSDDAEHGLYFAPRDYNEIAIVYNKTKFEHYGVEVPKVWNWDNFVTLLQTASQKIVDKIAENPYGRGNNDKVIYLHTSYEPVFTSIFEELKSDGIIVNKDLNLQSTTNRAIFNTLDEDIYSYEVELEGDIYRNIISKDEADFYNGISLMTVCPRPVVYSMYKKLINAGQEIDFLPFPTKKIAAGCSGYGMCAGYENATQTVKGVTKSTYDLCWDFIHFAITEQGQEAAGETGVSVPVLKSLKDTGKWREALDSKLNHNAFVQPEELHMSTFNCFNASKKIRSNLRTNVTSFFTQLESRSYSDIDTLLTKTKKAFDENNIENK